MPADAPLALVLVQHLARDQQSLLPEILAKRTALAMIEARDEMRIEAGRAYIIPVSEFDELPEEVRETLAIVQRNVSVEAQLIDDLLDLARITHGKLRVEKEAVDAHRTVLDALQTLEGELDAKQHELTLDLTADH